MDVGLSLLCPRACRSKLYWISWFFS